MKILVLLNAILTLTAFDTAHSASMDDYEIRVRHGSFTNTAAVYEVIEDHSSIDGDPAVLESEARQKWKVSCEDWKRERPEGAQVLTASCGRPDCVKESYYQVSCSSSGAKRLRVKIQD